MKLNFYLKLFLALVCVVGAKAQVRQQTFEAMMNQTIEECKVAENATEEDVGAMIYDEDWPETYEGKCFVECFFEEIGIFKNHKFNKRGFLSVALLLLDENDVDESLEIKGFHDMIATISDECGASQNDDRCENGMDFAKCLEKITTSFTGISNELNNDEPETEKN